ncbi:FG-GAP-like repeat-containing protein [Sandaracinus amylolyticus]|uniref:Putative Rhs protein n=1 Tax=Sandaracinus amylolyticus TaxID=927083 RepID=A0A0F6VZQ7_9BACT|nr:FG-GAP-like repeat-containing protein [Sandaracinus amylolyticus]AKF03565.1 putative Rhs protein [Sandaracinus amylolyticus]
MYSVRRSYSTTLASLALFGVLSSNASAQTYRDALVQTPTLAAPTRGSVAGTLASLRYAPSDLARGTFHLPSPFAAPIDRGPLLASAFPAYSPDVGLSEWGMGWSADLSIRRFRTIGTIDYSTSDELVSPWGRLVRGDDGALYPAALEDRVRVVADGGGYVATTSDGTRWIFRAADAVTNARGTYQWNVSEVISPLGDRTELVWTANASGRRFVSELRWGGRGATREHRAVLGYDTVPVALADHASGARMLLDRRVREIAMDTRDPTSGAWTRRWTYELAYRESPAGAAFYLTSVTRRFASGAAEPPVTYEYAMSEDRLATASLERMTELDAYLARVGGTGIQPEVVSFFDLEDDGRVDMEHRYDHSLVHHTDAGWTWEGAPPRDGDENALCRPAASHQNRPRLLVRMTPDATEPEVVVAYRSGASTGLVICDREGDPLHREAVPGAWDLGANTRLVDLDRDLRPDFVRVYRGGYEILRNVSDERGYRFERSAPGTLAPSFAPTATWVQDVNGDGLADLVARSTANVVVWFGLGGNRFESTGTTFGFLSSNGPVTNLGSFQITFTDANHDGLADALLSSGRYLMLFTNRGTHFQQIAVPGFSAITWTVGLPVAVDLDGRGEEQAVLVNGQSAYRITLSAPESGLMVRADDGRGGVARFQYRRARPTPGIVRRPPMLTRMEVSATGVAPVSFTYDYEDAVFHGAARHLLGFGTVRRDSPNAIESAEFHFDDDVSGLLVGTRVAADETDVFRFEARTYDEARFRGVRFLRPRDRHTGWSDRTGTVVDGTRTIHEAYANELCVTRARSVSRHGELVTENELDPVPGLGAALHCTPRVIRNLGTHPGRAELDFDYRAEIERDAIGMLTRITAIAGDRRLVLQEVAYDAQHRITSITAPSEGRTAMRYDPSTGLLTSITGPDGVVTAVTRDARTDALVKLLMGRGPGGDWNRTFHYDALERLDATWDDVGAGNAALPDLAYEYRYADATRPAAILSRQLIDASSRSVAETIELQAATGDVLATAVRTRRGWAFDGLTLADPSASRVDRFHRAPVSADPRSLTLAQLVDTASRTALGHRIDSALGHAIEEVTTVREGVRRTTGERVAVRADGVVHESIENGVVAGTSVTDGDDRVITTTDAAGATTTRSYDALGRLVRVALPGGAIQSVRYDRLGRVGAVVRSDVGRTELEYDDVGRMLRRRVFDTTGAELRSTRLEHDAIGRVVREVHRRASDGAEIAYERRYDEGTGELGQLTSVRGPGFVRRERHHRDGRVARSELELTGFRTIIVERSYAEDGVERSATRTVLDPSGRVLLRSEQTTEHDALGRVARRTLGGAPLYELAYDDEGRVSHVAFANGELLVMRFDPVTHGRIGYDHVTDDWTLGVEVERDARGLVSAERVELSTGGAPPVVHDREYVYDARRFLTERRGPDGASAYTYDAASRIASSSDLAGRRTHTRRGRTATIGSTTYRYDAAGRVIARDGTTMTYGAHGELDRVTRDGRSFTYVYDESGARLLKLDGPRVVAAFVDGAYLSDAMIVEPVEVAGRLVGVLVNGAYRSIATDPRGTPLATSDGTFVDASPYGVRRDRTDLSVALDYVEHGYDADLGTVRIGARDYDPMLGELLTPDPLYAAEIDRCASDPVQCTLYAYASNDPIAHVDPSGLESRPTLDVDITLRLETGDLQVASSGNAISDFVLSPESRIHGLEGQAGAIAESAQRGYNGQWTLEMHPPSSSWWNELVGGTAEVVTPEATITDGDVRNLTSALGNIAAGGELVLPDSGVTVHFEVANAYALSDWESGAVASEATRTSEASQQSSWGGGVTLVFDTARGPDVEVSGERGFSNGTAGRVETTTTTTIPMRGRDVVGRVTMVLEGRQGSVRWRHQVDLGYRRVFQTAPRAR